MSERPEVLVLPVRDAVDREAFVRLPDEIYRDDPAWVPPLYRERRQQIDPRENPFFERGTAEFFLAFRDGRAVGSISAQVDREVPNGEAETGYFGCFESIDEPAVARALLGAAENWLRARGKRTIRGPFSLTMNQYAGLLIEGFGTRPMVMMPHHRPYYRTLLESEGYQKAKDLLATCFDPRTIDTGGLRRAAAPVASSGRLRLREIERKNLSRDLEIVRRIYNSAWQSNWGFVPVTQSEIIREAKELSPVHEPRLALIVEQDNRPVAVSLVLPDINTAIHDFGGTLSAINLAKLLWRTKVSGLRRARWTLLGLLPEVRSPAVPGLLQWILFEHIERIRALNIEFVEMSWMLEDNTRINRVSDELRSKLYKRYRVFDKPLRE